MALNARPRGRRARDALSARSRCSPSAGRLRDLPAVAVAGDAGARPPRGGRPRAGYRRGGGTAEGPAARPGPVRRSPAVRDRRRGAQRGRRSEDAHGRGRCRVRATLRPSAGISRCRAAAAAPRDERRQQCRDQDDLDRPSARWTRCSRATRPTRSSAAARSRMRAETHAELLELDLAAADGIAAYRMAETAWLDRGADPRRLRARDRLPAQRPVRRCRADDRRGRRLPAVGERTVPARRGDVPARAAAARAAAYGESRAALEWARSTSERLGDRMGAAFTGVALCPAPDRPARPRRGRARAARATARSTPPSAATS